MPLDRVGLEDVAARTLIETLPDERNPDGFVFPKYANGRCQDSLVWIYPVSVDSLWLSPPALSWATAGGRKVFPKIGG